MTIDRSSHARATVCLRNVAESDLPVLFKHQRDPEANAMAAFPPRDHDAFMIHWAKILNDESLIAKAIVVDGSLVGNIGSFTVQGQRLVGYWIGREYWGRGVATEALRQFLECETIRPLHARVVKSNVGSVRVLEKCGFKVAGEEAFKKGAGEAVDEWIMQLG